MSRRSLDGARCLVTGASSGIGRALVVELVRGGARVVASARRGELLQELQQELGARATALIPIPGDITDVDHRRELLRVCQEHLGGLDVLINNAGIGGIGRFESAGPERARRIFEVNFFAPIEFIRESLPWLRHGRRPLIVNVSSVLGHRAVPNKAEYCASKFALHGFSDALRAELAAERIDVLLVSPSTTATEFFHKAGGRQLTLGKRLGGAMSAERVARQIVSGIRAGRSEIILSWGGRAIVWLDRLCPPLANWLVAKWG